MFKWLILLGAALYGVLLIGGEDRGQLRAGLREQPVPAVAVAQAAETAPSSLAQPVLSAGPPPGSPPGSRPASPPLTLQASETVRATLPAQPIRILPPPQVVQATVTSAGDSVTAEPALDPAESAATEDALPPNAQLRWVAVDRANVRKGPSRSASVTGRIEGGEAVLVLWVEESGWARIRVEGDGVDGFIHASLLSETDPQAD